MVDRRLIRRIMFVIYNAPYYAHLGLEDGNRVYVEDLEFADEVQLVDEIIEILSNESHLWVNTDGN